MLSYTHAATKLSCNPSFPCLLCLCDTLAWQLMILYSILVDFSPTFYCLPKPLSLYGSMVLLSTLECFNDWGGRGYNDSVPGDGTKTTPSGDRATRSLAWSASLPRIQFISPGGWSNKFPGGVIFVPSPLKTGTKLLHPRPPPNCWNTH